MRASWPSVADTVRRGKFPGWSGKPGEPGCFLQPHPGVCQLGSPGLCRRAGATSAPGDGFGHTKFASPPLMAYALGKQKSLPAKPIPTHPRRPHEYQPFCYSPHLCFGAKRDGSCHFLTRYPTFSQTKILDDLRTTDYGRLDQTDQVYLDYTGGGLYADSQGYPPPTWTSCAPASSATPTPTTPPPPP